jgi:hypothetical protein
MLIGGGLLFEKGQAAGSITMMAAGRNTPSPICHCERSDAIFLPNVLCPMGIASSLRSSQ